jgi:phytanoyl-CoA hydroxylase
MDISSEQVAQFERDGFLIVEKIISPSRVKCINEAVTRVFNGRYNRDIRPPALRKPVASFGEESRLRWMIHARLVDADLWDLATDAGLGMAAASLLQTSSVSMIEDQLLVKPGPGAPFALHQDHTYWSFSTSTSTLSLWLALSDMTPDLGPVEVIRGSYRWGLIDTSKGAKEGIKRNNDEYLSDANAFNRTRADLEFVPALVPEGGGIFFHGLTVHGSRSNSTDQWRRAVALHWAASDCRLDRSKLVAYPYPFVFSGLQPGDQLVNKYMPRVYPTVTTS